MSRRTQKSLSIATAVAVVAATVQIIAVATSPSTAPALATPVTGTGGQFVPVQGRAYDSRAGSNTQLPAGTWRKIQIAGVANVPTTGVSAVALTFTVISPAGAGLIRADKDDSTPNTATAYMQYDSSPQQSNSGVVAVAPNGNIQIYSSQATNIVLDVQGYYTADDSVSPGGYVPVEPKRLVDTRNGTGLPQASLSGGASKNIQVGGSAGVPVGASAAMLNFTITNNNSSATHGFYAYPSGSSRPTGGYNFVPGGNDGTMAQIGLSSGGALTFDLTGSGYSVDLVVDVVGYFTTGQATGAFTPAAARVWDSRTSGHTSVGSGATAKVQIAGVAGIPLAGSGISSITANIAAISTGSNSGGITVFANGTSRPVPLSSLSYAAGATVSNMVTSALGSNGAISVYNSGPDAIDFVVDIEGWYTNVGSAITNGQTTTAQFLTLQANPAGGGAWVRYQYRMGLLGNFATVPNADMKDKNGSQPAASYSQKTSGAFPAYAWNLRDTLAAANNGNVLDSLIQVQACYGTSASDANPACGMPTSVLFSQLDDEASSIEIGPGTVSEVTGNFEVGASDADAQSSLGSLSVGRTLSTLQPTTSAGAAGVFGPGWTAAMDDGGAGNLTVSDHAADGYILFTAPSGTVSTYVNTDSSPSSFVGMGDNAGDGMLITKNNSSTITMTDGSNTVTTWVKSSNGAWQVASVKQPGSNSTTTYTYGTAGITSGLVTRILAPVPDGVSCATPDTTPGCRSLVLSYTTNAPARLSTVALSIPQTSGTPKTTTVAQYSYDNSNRLISEWDPRITPNLTTSYTYTSANRLATLTPPGLAPYAFSYDSKNRLSTITRPDPSGQTATTTVVYDVPTNSSDTSVRPDLTSNATGTWGETDDLPVTGTALFDAKRVPAGSSSSSVGAADWPYASIDYMDVNARTVNSARYGAGKWLIDTTQFDGNGNEAWSLTPGNREQALNPTTDTDSYVSSKSSNVARAALLSSTITYDPKSPGQVTDTFGPTHPVTLSDQTVIDARTHVTTNYDEGAPSATNSATGMPYGLPTSSITSAWNPNTGVDSSWPDLSITRVGYDPIVSGDAGGWDLGQATSNVVQMGATASSADLASYTRYDSNGRVIEQRLPGDSTGAGPRTTDTTYYSGSATGGCADVTRTGLVCNTSPAGQPTTGKPLPTTSYVYDAFGKPTTKTETYGSGSSAIVRTTTLGYDAGERPVTHAVVVTPAAAGGGALPTVTTTYDNATGLATTISTTAGGTTTSLSTGYDNLGRETSYSDASGVQSTTTYDLAGSVKTSNDSKHTITYTTDSSSEHRGGVTSEDIGVSGALSAFQATYDAAGNVAVETYPNGVTATRSFDNDGNLVKLVYAKGNATWMTFTQAFNAIGQVAAQSSPQSSQHFTYDPEGRLANVQDTYQNACVTRVYSFDNHSNRKQLNSYPAGTNNGCTVSTTPTTKSYNYDEADRLTSDTAGAYAYDALGRTTTVPAADANGTGGYANVSGDVNLTYFANDMVKSQSQGNVSMAFALDPLQNRIASKTDGQNATVEHYDNSTDSPSWNSTAAGWTEFVTGPTGSLVAAVDQAQSVTFQLANPHGDIVATVPDSANASAPTMLSEATEYGMPRQAQGAQQGAYDWVGERQRDGGILGGEMVMGARLYVRSSGRFLTVDPVPGGNDNAYIYPADPVNSFDFNGKFHWYIKYDLEMSRRAAINYAHQLIRGLSVADFVAMVLGWSGGWGALIGAVAQAFDAFGIEMAHAILRDVGTRGLHIRVGVGCKYYWNPTPRLWYEMTTRGKKKPAR